MTFFVFTVVVLIATQGAYGIRCHQCQPDAANISSAVSLGDFSTVNLCNNPTGSFDCSQDPYIGSFADACYTASVTINISHFNIGEITYHVQDCAMKSGCSQLKTMTCDTLNTSFAGISGFSISHCDVSCCKQDLCNNPSGPPTTSPSESSNTGLSGSPTTSPSGSSNTGFSGSPTTRPSVSSIIGFPTSTATSTHIPPNASIFVALGVVTYILAKRKD